MDQALNSQKTPHTSPLRASYGMSFVSILMKNDRVIKGFYSKQDNKDGWVVVVVYKHGETMMALFTGAYMCHSGSKSGQETPYDLTQSHYMNQCSHCENF